jgi:CelD/BcsL family acetyltransferase involved in cellulose biosynthesis
VSAGAARGVPASGGTDPGTSSIRVVSDFASIRDEWAELAAQLAAPPFMQPGWFEAWWSAFGQGHAAIICARSSTELVGVLPGSVLRGAFRSMTNWHTPFFSILGERDEDVSLVLAQAMCMSTTHTQLGFVSDDAPRLDTLRALTEQMGRRPLVRVIQRSPFADLGAGWDAFEASLSRNVRNDVRRRRRALEAAGSLEVSVERGGHGLDDLLAEGFRVESAGWKGEAGTAVSSRPDTRAFYTSIAHWAASTGSLRLSFLRLDGRAIAFQYGLEEDGVYYYLKGGYDPSHRAFSPGKVLHHAMLERLARAGCRRYEFLGDEEPYKVAWGNGVRELLAFQAFPPTLAGRLARFGWVHGRNAAKALRRLRRTVAQR